MLKRAGAATLAATILLAIAAPSAQVVRTTETPFRPFAASGESPSAKGPNPETFSQHYVTAALTGAGELSDSSGTVQVSSSPQFQFPSVRFTLSVASIAAAARGDSGLRRLHAHVRVQAANANGQPLDGAPVQTLAISPSERSSSAATSNAGSELKQAASMITSRLGHIGAVVTAFENAFHRSPHVTQMAYQSSADQFGWRWSRAATDPIDGLHYTSALLQVPAAAAALRLQVEIVSDWDHAGAWMKTYDLVLSLK